MPRHERFRTTRWSMVVAAAGARDESSAQNALAELCEQYWYPLYAFARRTGCLPDDARDLTQGYFAELLEKNWLRQVDRDAGRFRSFLLVSFRHSMSRQRERDRALRRGGAHVIHSLDAVDAEQRYAMEPRDERTPEEVYDERWALTVLERVNVRLQREFEAAGKGEQYSALAGFLTGDGEDKSYRQIADEQGTTEPAVKMAVRRLRQRFGALLREEIAHTVRDASEVDAEIRHLLAAIRGRR